MNWGAYLKRQLGQIAGASVVNMGNIIIFTSIAGWFASSAAQIIGIALNKNYTKDQKKFMITQEAADCITNIGLYVAATKPLTALASHMVKTGKLAPKSIAEFLRTTNYASQRGKFGFDVTQVPRFNAVGLGPVYNSFKGFTDAATATVGGIISSNILTPIVRNYIASHRQNKYKAKMQQMEANTPNIQVVTPVQTPDYSTYRRPTFDTFRNHSMRV